MTTDWSNYQVPREMALNFPQMQGESNYQYLERMKREQQGLDANRAVQDRITGANTYGTVGSGTSGPAIMQQNRDAMFDRLRDPERIFQGDMARRTNSAILRQMSGQDAPITDDVLARIQTQSADQIGAAQQAQYGQIREGFAARGLGGSGLQLGAELDTAQEGAAARNQALNETLIQQATQNFDARERSRQDALNFTNLQVGATQPSAIEEARIRNTFSYDGQGGGGGYANVFGAPQQQPGQGGASFGGGMGTVSPAQQGWQPPQPSQPRQVGTGTLGGPPSSLGGFGSYQQPSNLPAYFSGQNALASAPAANPYGSASGVAPNSFNQATGQWTKPLGQTGRGGGYG